ncbi:MAG: molybdopterin-dependent oxidoreductase [Actinomycetota bacterium]|nr:molybdopterin-dependent oxidoreductase [Actinomycetota bacterium]
MRTLKKSVERAPDRRVQSVCKMCLHGCGIVVHIEDGVVTKIEGDPTNLDNLGKLCPKGNVGMLRLYDPRRVKAPMVRTNPEKGPGVDPGWKEISWDEAMGLVTEKLKPLRETDPRKLVVASGDFQRIFNWAWPAAFGSPHFFSTVGQYCGAAYHPINGITDTSFAAVNDYEYCKYWLQVGAGDGFSSHLHLSGSAKRMADARMNGMRVVTVEPRMSPAAAKADEWVPIRPGTDRAFALGLMHSMVFEHKIYDRGFLQHRTNAPYLIGPSGSYALSADGKAMVWDRVAGRAREWDDPGIGDFALEGRYKVGDVSCAPGFQLFLDILERHTPERMEEVCSVPAATMRRLARELGEAAHIGETITLEDKEYPYRPAAVNYYRGAIAHKDGGQDAMALKMLNTLLGNIDVPGGHLGVPLDLRGFFIEPDEHGMLKPQPHILHPPVPFKFPADSLQMMEWFPLGMDAGHIAVDAMLNPERYRLDYVPEVLLTYHSNPVWNMPAPDKVRRAIAKFKYVISIDVVVNPTTEWADLILPDHTYLESTVAVSLEPPVVKGLALRQAVIPPMYDTRDATEILIDIAERCGFLDVWNGFLSFLLGLTVRDDLVLAPDRKYSNEEIIDRMCRAAYDDDHDLEWFKVNGHMVTKRTAAETYLPYDGLRIPFYYETIRAAGEQLKAQFAATGYDWDTSAYVPLPAWCSSPIHIEDTEYPLYAITFKTAETNFAETMSIPVISELTRGAAQTRGVLLNPRTAKRYGIADGDSIEIASRFGRVEGSAALTETVHPEVVAVSNAVTGNGRKLGTHFNVLLPSELEYTDIFTGALESVARVVVHKVGKEGVA